MWYQSVTLIAKPVKLNMAKKDGKEKKCSAKVQVFYRVRLCK